MYRSSDLDLIEEANVGTTAEIYEYREPSASNADVVYHIKAIGRQRFKGKFYGFTKNSRSIIR